MKRILPVLLTFALLLTGCQTAGRTDSDVNSNNSATVEDTRTAAPVEGAVNIALSDDGITVDGEEISDDAAAAVYAANDIVFYLEGQDLTYGEGTEEDAHAQSEADGHTVVHITRPGTYAVSGKLSAGQIAIDLGEDAREDPEAVVTLILNGVDINCTVAPAVIFYSVYECGSTDAETASATVDTAAAGANVIIADGTENYVTGSYVARIYKPDSVRLNDAGTEVLEAERLHKYDSAFYSKMSMNVGGGEEGDGFLWIDAENEGLDSELHLTINGGTIQIESGNDGINTNEDGVSVTTINDGTLTITVTGETGEGDGIDSNGWLVINGGFVTAQACSVSEDAGIDSDMGIYLNGGTVMAYGNMLDRIAGGSANYVVFQFAERQTGGDIYTLQDSNGEVAGGFTAVNDFTYMLVSAEELLPGEYTLWRGDTQLAGSGSSAMGQMGDMTPPGGFDQQPIMPEGMTLPEGTMPFEEMGNQFQRNEDGTITRPDGTTVDPSEIPQPGEEGQTMSEVQMAPSEGMTMPEGQMVPPEGMTMPEGQMVPSEGMTMPEGQTAPEGMTIPEGQTAPTGNGDRRGENRFQGQLEMTTTFTIVQGGNYFTNVAPAQQDS